MSTIGLHRSLSRMAVFAHVVDLGSFSAAGDALGLSKSAVSKQVAELERDFGVQLLHRTTRRLRVTEAGRAFFDSCARVVGEAETIEQTLAALHRQPRGTLRVNAPVAFGTAHVAPVVAEFLRAHEGLRVDLTLQDEFVDVVGEGVDVAIRIGRLADSSLVARKLTPVPLALCASPSYLARAGTPESHRDLRRHEMIVYALSRTPGRLSLVHAGRRVRATMAGRLVTNSGGAIREAALAGLGIGLLPEFFIERDLASGALVRVLPDHALPATSAHALFPAGHSVSAKVRLFVDLLAARLGEGHHQPLPGEPLNGPTSSDVTQPP